MGWMSYLVFTMEKEREETTDTEKYIVSEDEFRDRTEAINYYISLSGESYDEVDKKLGFLDRVATEDGRHILKSVIYR